MEIGEIINYYGEEHTPYIGSLVNHLPMGQLAIYKMTKNLDTVKDFTNFFLEKRAINGVNTEFLSIEHIEESLGNRDMYEAALELIRKESREKTIEEYAKLILNKYGLGLSSGLFHTTIRLAYAIEGMRIDSVLREEVERALAYYITAYRESELFSRSIKGSNIKAEMNNLVNDGAIRENLSKEDSLGMKIRFLYREKEYLNKGFIIRGDAEDKIRALLDLLVPAYYFSGNIVILHCITGLHATIVLKDFFDDYSRAIDILTTSIITHLLATGYDNYEKSIVEYSPVSWEALISIGSERYDVHAVKLTYSAYELDNLYKIEGLKDIVIKRIRGI